MSRYGFSKYSVSFIKSRNLQKSPKILQRLSHFSNYIIIWCFKNWFCNRNYNFKATFTTLYKWKAFSIELSFCSVCIVTSYCYARYAMLRLSFHRTSPIRHPPLDLQHYNLVIHTVRLVTPLKSYNLIISYNLTCVPCARVGNACNKDTYPV